MNVSPAMTPPDCILPGLLLVEDDPTSAAFLSDAAAQLPARIHIAKCIAEARAACRNQAFDLLLIDAHLPDGTGIALLRELRTAGVQVPALAHTAEAGSALHDQLLAAGFCEVLRKPMPVATLHAALRRQLGDRAAPSWNDGAALAVLGGRADQVAALRRMFLAELPDQRRRIASAVQQLDAAAVRAELHRLDASCGFVGAARLACSVRDLRTEPLDLQRWQALDAAITDLLSAPAPAPPTTTA